MCKKYFYLFYILFIFIPISSVEAADYNPLKNSIQTNIKTFDLVVHDTNRNRDVPVLVYTPAGEGRYPVVLFSHGLGGSRFGSDYLGKHWAARGYVVVYIQHPGSDESVWKDQFKVAAFLALKQAANLENFMLRVDDVSAVLDQLELWNLDVNSPLHAKMDMNLIAMSGHSFGAVTTQAVSGQMFKNGTVSLMDGRIKAAIAFSPSSPRDGADLNMSFGRVEIPWLLMTGTNDVAGIGDQDVNSRMAVFPALPAGNKYEVVLNGAEHSAFTDRALPGDKRQRNPNHHRSILALSTAFLDAYLRNDKAAKAWLDQDGPVKILDQKDLWLKK